MSFWPAESLRGEWKMTSAFKKDRKPDHSIWAILFYLIFVTCINTLFISCYILFPRWVRWFLGVQSPFQTWGQKYPERVMKTLCLNLCILKHHMDLFYQLKKSEKENCPSENMTHCILPQRGSLHQKMGLRVIWFLENNI